MIKIEVQGQPRLEEVLQALSKALDPTEILDESAALLLSRNRRRYLQEVNPDNVPWIQSEAAKKRKAKGVGGGTLFHTGRLFHSIQLAGAGAIERFIGTDVPYAPYVAASQNWDFLGFNDDDVTTVQKLLIKRIRSELG